MAKLSISQSQVAVKGSTTLTEKNIKSSPVKEQIKGTPIGGGFRDWPKGEEPPKKTKLKEWNPTTQTLEVNKGDISKHLSFNMETGEMKIKKNNINNYNKDNKINIINKLKLNNKNKNILDN